MARLFSGLAVVKWGWGIAVEGGAGESPAVFKNIIQV
jgi:hypothetical protein